MAKETYVYGKRDLCVWQKRPAVVAKEACKCGNKRAPAHLLEKNSRQKRPICMAKETYVYGKRDLFVWQKRPICMAKETCWRRIPGIAPKMCAAERTQAATGTCVSKEACECGKRDLLFGKETYNSYAIGANARALWLRQAHPCQKRPANVAKRPATQHYLKKRPPKP